MAYLFIDEIMLLIALWNIDGSDNGMLTLPEPKFAPDFFKFTYFSVTAFNKALFVPLDPSNII